MTADESTSGNHPSCASPPCSLHDLDADASASRDAADHMPRPDIMRWRKAERERLIAARLAASAAERASWADKIAEGLDGAIGDVRDLIVSVYWPFRGEPDLRGWMKAVTARGGACALPVVVEKGRPLVFRDWKEGEPLERGIWNIPIPAAGPRVVQDVTIAPVVASTRSAIASAMAAGSSTGP